MLAAYLVKHLGMDPHDAIVEIRTRRPLSIETHEQENVIYEYSEKLKSNMAPDEPNTSSQLPHTHFVGNEGP